MTYPSSEKCGAPDNAGRCQLADDMPLFLVTFLPNGVLTYANKALAASVGMTPAQLIGKNFYDFLTPPDRERVRTALASLTPAAPEESHEQHYPAPDGFGTFHQWTNRAFFNEAGELTHYQAVGEDITARKRTELQIRASESNWHALFDSMPDPVFITSMSGQFLRVSRSACEKLKYSEGELLAMGPADIDTLEQATKVPERINNIFKHGYSVFESEHRRKDGLIFPVEISAHTIEFDGLPAIISVAHDITERKKADALLRESYRLLEEKELAKTRFLAAAGHDLRQPVTAANLFISTLKLTQTSEQQRRLLDQLSTSMKTFSELLDRLLNISKFDAGLIKPLYSSMDIRDLFKWLDQHFAEPARSKQLDFRFHVPANRSLIVRTDIALLQSAAMNLVSNAIKFTTEGGVLIAARPRAGHVLLQVWDTGIGITPEDQLKIFDEFFQAANPRRNRSGGLGLGLSIAQRALALQGVGIVCRSTPERGSVFEIALPLAGELGPTTPRANAAPLHDISDSAFFGGKSVVIVEDDTLVSTALMMLLEDLGARVRLFYTAEEALTARGIAETDYFIVDYSLGGNFNGQQFLEALQQILPSPIRAVIVTGETSSEFIANVSSLRWPVLHKPVDLSEITASLLAQTDQPLP